MLCYVSLRFLPFHTTENQGKQFNTAHGYGVKVAECFSIPAFAVFGEFFCHFAPKNCFVGVGWFHPRQIEFAPISICGEDKFNDQSYLPRIFRQLHACSNRVNPYLLSFELEGAVRSTFTPSFQNYTLHTSLGSHC